MVNFYVMMIRKGVITINDVPEYDNMREKVRVAMEGA